MVYIVLVLNLLKQNNIYNHSFSSFL